MLLLRPRLSALRHLGSSCRTLLSGARLRLAAIARSRAMLRRRSGTPFARGLATNDSVQVAAEYSRSMRIQKMLSNDPAHRDRGWHCQLPVVSYNGNQVRRNARRCGKRADLIHRPRSIGIESGLDIAVWTLRFGH
jgi:hypothetical protein